MRWATRNEVYDGEWSDDMPHGRGVHTWYDAAGTGAATAADAATQRQSLNRYDGEWSRGQRHGFGVFYYANGARYEGQWEANRKHGHGVLVLADGSIVEGFFDADRMVRARADAAPHPRTHPSRTAAGFWLNPCRCHGRCVWGTARHCGPAAARGGRRRRCRDGAAGGGQAHPPLEL
jgi:hypothetical protein